MSCVPLPTPSGAAAAPLPCDPYSTVLHRVMATELMEIRQKLEELSMVMVCDAHFTANYLEQLQSFDYLIQHAEECANVMTRIAEGEDSLEAIGHVRLGAVQDRLRTALKGEPHGNRQ